MNPSSIWPDTKVTKSERLFFKIVAWVVMTPVLLAVVVFGVPLLILLLLISLIDWAWLELIGKP